MIKRLISAAVLVWLILSLSLPPAAFAAPCTRVAGYASVDSTTKLLCEQQLPGDITCGAGMQCTETIITGTGTATGTATQTATTVQLKNHPTLVNTSTGSLYTSGGNVFETSATVTGTDTLTDTYSYTATQVTTATGSGTWSVTQTSTQTGNLVTGGGDVTGSATSTVTTTGTATKTITGSVVYNSTQTITATVTATATITSSDTNYGSATVTVTKTATATANGGTASVSATATAVITRTSTGTGTRTWTAVGFTGDELTFYYTYTGTVTATGSATGTVTGPGTITLTDTETHPSTYTVTSTATATSASLASLLSGAVKISNVPFVNPGGDVFFSTLGNMAVSGNYSSMAMCGSPFDMDVSSTCQATIAPSASGKLCGDNEYWTAPTAWAQPSLDGWVSPGWYTLTVYLRQNSAGGSGYVSFYVGTWDPGVNLFVMASTNWVWTTPPITHASYRKYTFSTYWPHGLDTPYKSYSYEGAEQKYPAVRGVAWNFGGVPSTIEMGMGGSTSTTPSGINWPARSPYSSGINGYPSSNEQCHNY